MKKTAWMISLLVCTLYCSTLSANAAVENDPSGAVSPKIEQPAERPAYNAQGKGESPLSTPKAHNETVPAAPEAPKRALEYYRQGLICSIQKDDKGAIAAFNEALKLNADYVDVYAARGKSYERLGNELRVQFDDAAQMKITTEGYYMLSPRTEGNYQEKQQREIQYMKKIAPVMDNYYRLALDDFNRYLKLQPNAPQATNVYIDRGLVYVGLGKHADGIFHHSSAEQLNLRYLDLVEPKQRQQWKLRQAQADAAIRDATPHIAENYQKARDDFNEALRRNPDSAEAYALRGDLYYSWGRYLLEAAKAPRGYWTTRFQKSPLPKDAPPVDLTYYRQAIADYQKALVLSQKRPDLILSIAEIYKSSYEFDKALDVFDKALEVPSEQDMAVYGRAGIYISLGQWEQVQAELSRYMKDKEKVSLAIGLGIHNDRFRNTVETVMDLTEKIAAAPFDAAHYLARGNQFFYANRKTQAIADYTRAIALGTRQADLYWQRGESYRELMQWKKALADYETAESLGLLTQEENDPNRIVRAAFYQRRSPMLRESGAYEYLLPSERRDVQLYVRRGLAHEMLGQAAAANQDYTRAIALRPEIADLYFSRFRCRTSLGIYHLAIADLLQILRINPKAEWAYWMMGEIYANNIKDDAKALECFNHAIERFPNDESAIFARGMLYDRRGEAAKAAADFQKINPVRDPDLFEKIPKKYR